MQEEKVNMIRVNDVSGLSCDSSIADPLGLMLMSLLLTLIKSHT